MQGMTKVRVQDATKELSIGTGRLLDSVSRSRKQVQDVLQQLKRLKNDAAQKENEQKELQAREELKRQQEQAAAFVSGYSSEQMAEAVAASKQAAEAAAQKKAEEARKAEEEAAARQAAPEARPQAAAPRTAQPQQRPMNQGDRPYGRPVNPGDRPYGRPVNQGDRPYGRPVNQGDRPYGRPANPGDRPYGRPANGGDRPYGRPAGQGDRPYGHPAGGMGKDGDRPMGGKDSDRPQRPFGNRPQGGGARPQGGGFGRKLASELAPVAEKERVSNYDPNKKIYERQNDPERNANASKRSAGKNNTGRNVNIKNAGYDDDFERGKKSKRKQQAAQPKPEPVKIEKAYMTAETITVKDLSERIGKPTGEIIKKLLLLGIMATINAELDYDTALLVASDYGIELEKKIDKTAEEALEEEDFTDKEDDLVPRNPIVTIMGHVDHGKTSLLDYIRKAHVTSTEAGGITQHIGAYTVSINGRGITFLDTPGHEAFTAMRARGAMITDIAILVVAADDGVMPQTIESINHAKAANVPVIVAINKCDKPTANPDRVKTELTEYGLVAEDWGGDTIMVPVSALTGEGVNDLLESILLVADMAELKANPNRKARGGIIEAKLDKGRGPVATVLVQNGTLRVGDMIVAGTAYGRVRAMVNDRGERVKSAGPSMPVEVIGFNDVPSAGDTISAVDDDRLSRQVAEERKDKLRAALIKSQTKTSLDDLFSQISAGQIKDLNIIVKADVQGSVEAVKQSLEKLSNDEVRVRCIHGGVGAITETDVLLASASNAIIIGFNVRHDNAVRDLAEKEGVDIRLYRVIYNAIEDVENAMKGMLAPKFKETALGRAQVRQTYKITGIGMVAGCYVTEGKLQRGAQARLLRDNIVIVDTKIASLRRFKDDAKEVAAGYECGATLENYSDIKENDVIECYLMEEIQQ